MIDWLRQNPDDLAVEISGRPLPVVIRRNHRARRLTMRLSPDGSEIRITMPQWGRTAEALAFVRLREGWLAEQLGRVPARETPAPGGTLFFRGEELEISWREKAPRRPALAEQAVVLGGPQAGLEQRLRRWLEGEAKRLLEDDLLHYCARAGQEPPALRLSRAERRWGSCSTGGTIRINWRLIQAPDAVRRSVVAHEVAHLVHFDHSPAFHALLGKVYDGDIKQADRWLKAHGRSLYALFG